MKKIYACLLLCVLSWNPTLFAQTCTLGSVIAEPGEEVLVPLEFAGLNNVGAVSLYITYNDGVAGFVDIDNLAPEAAGTLANATIIMDSTVVGISWVAPGSAGVDFSDGKFFDLRFNYVSGSTDLGFFTMICEIVDFDVNPINVTYTNGSISGNTGAVYSEWNGDGNWIDPQFWSDGVPGFGTSAVIMTGTVNISSGAVCNKLRIEPGAMAKIHPDFFLTVSDSLGVYGDLLLKSSAEGSGSLIANGEIIDMGNLSVELFLTGDGSAAHLVSSPAADQTAGQLGSSIVSSYNESAQEWVDLGGADILEEATGYRVVSPADQAYTFEGMIRNQDVTVSLSYTQVGGSLPAGMNLLGNPYTSAIDLNSDNWTGTNTDRAVYTWNGTQYVSWNGEIGSLENGIVPAMQGFFMIANAGNAQITIPEASRIHSNQPYYKEQKEVENMLKLVIMNDTCEDHAWFKFDNDAISGFDHQYDAYKLFGMETAPQLYSFTDDAVPLSINVFPTPDADSALPLGVMLASQGEYQIVRTEFSVYGKPIYLKDKETGDTLNLKADSVYTFTSDAGTFEERFLLYFSIPVSSITENPLEDVNIYSAGNELRISFGGPKKETLVEVFDLAGKRFITTRFEHAAECRITLNGRKGFFIVRVSSGASSIASKVFIH